MIDTEIFDLLYTHLEERSANNVRDQLNADHDYQDALAKECDLFQQYENLNLSKEQEKIIEAWGEAITARNGAYSAVIFRMGMQCYFSLLMQLADLKRQKIGGSPQLITTAPPILHPTIESLKLLLNERLSKNIFFIGLKQFLVVHKSF